MKTILLIAGLIAVLVLGLPSCSPEPETMSLEVSIDQLMEQNHISREVEVPVGETLTVVLGSNPSTGFSWSENAEIGDPTVLDQVNHQFNPSENEMPGSAGQEQWEFLAMEKGTTTVAMEYRRPWEGGEQGEWSFSVTVNVK